MPDDPTDSSSDSVASRIRLYWLPLGAGERTGIVSLSGRLYEALSARRAHRPRQALYHSALRVNLDGTEFVIEMAPVWSMTEPDRGVIVEGSVGFARLGRFRVFRYEVRCWPGGHIPDRAYAVDSPHELDSDPSRAALLVRSVADFPARTWGLDEQDAGEMWNSNSLTSWLLCTSGHDTDVISPPIGGRAPGWEAGLVVARAALSSTARPR
jgi:hypothetical protein